MMACREATTKNSINISSSDGNASNKTKCIYVLKSLYSSHSVETDWELRDTINRPHYHIDIGCYITYIQPHVQRSTNSNALYSLLAASYVVHYTVFLLPFLINERFSQPKQSKNSYTSLKILNTLLYLIFFTSSAFFGSSAVFQQISLATI